MKNKETELDVLTGIHNLKYLTVNYQKYIDKHPDAKFIMFDFKKFKHINDTYGHDVGDKYLILFARILNNVFTNSIVTRLHGDEYAIVTKYNEEKIEKLLDICDAEIKLAVDSDTIPEIFSYNAGVTNVEHSIDKTSEKADYMMYHGKKNNQRIQFFNEDIWQGKIKFDSFINSVEDDIQNDRITYRVQDFYNNKKEKVNISQIFSSDKNNQSLFTGDMYDALRNNAVLKKLDLYNVQHLLTMINSENNKFIVNFDYKSIIAKVDLLNYLKLLIDIKGLKAGNVIISVNMNDIDYRYYDDIINILASIKKLGFQICLDRYNSKTVDSIYEDTDIDYVKFDTDYWKKGLYVPKIEYVIGNKVNMFANSKDQTVPIFTRVERDNEYDFITNFTNSPILLSGNYFEKEKVFTKKDL